MEIKSVNEGIGVRVHKALLEADPEGIRELRQWLANNMLLVKPYQDFSAGPNTFMT